MKADFHDNADSVGLLPYVATPRLPASELDVFRETMRDLLAAHGDQSVHPQHRLTAPLEPGSSGNVGTALPLAAAAVRQRSL